MKRYISTRARSLLALSGRHEGRFSRRRGPASRRKRGAPHDRAAPFAPEFPSGSPVTSARTRKTGPADRRTVVSRRTSRAVAPRRVPVNVEVDARPLAIDIPAGRGEADGAPVEPMVEVPLVRLAWGRSGDKGSLSNIGLIARRAEWLPLIWNRLSPEVVRRYFAHVVKGRVERYHLPGWDEPGAARRTRRRRTGFATLRSARQGDGPDAARSAGVDRGPALKA